MNRRRYLMIEEYISEENVPEPGRKMGIPATRVKIPESGTEVLVAIKADGDDSIGHEVLTYYAAGTKLHSRYVPDTKVIGDTPEARLLAVVLGDEETVTIEEDGFYETCGIQLPDGTTQTQYRLISPANIVAWGSLGHARYDGTYTGKHLFDDTAVVDYPEREGGE